MVDLLGDYKCVELVQGGLVVGYGYAEPEADVAGARVGQMQRWLLLPGYVKPPAGTVLLRAPADPTFVCDTLDKWKDLVGNRWRPALGGVYAKARLRYCPGPPVPSANLPRFPDPVPPDAITLAAREGATALLGGATRLGITGNVGGTVVDLVAEPSSRDPQGGTQRTMQWDTRPAEIVQGLSISLIWVSLVSQMADSTRLRSTYEHFVLDSRLQSANTKPCTTGPTTEALPSYSDWEQAVKPGGQLPAGYTYAVAACNYYYSMIDRSQF